MRGILGADIFINLLLVFIITTGLLLMNTNRSIKIGKVENTENSLIKVDLPKGASKGVAGGRKNRSLALSARKSGSRIQYFVEDKPVAFSSLLSAVKSAKPLSVRVRFDKNISYGDYVRVLDLCMQAGVRDITNVYTIEK